MEQNNILDAGLGGLDSMDKHNLQSAGKWAKFIGIINYIVAGLIVIASIAMLFGGGMIADRIPGFGGGLIFGAAVLYLGMAVLYFFIGKSLHGFGKHAKIAAITDDTNALSQSLSNLKTFFTIVGVLTLVFVIIYGIFLLIALFGGLAALAN
jgi:hypothetical protein